MSSGPIVLCVLDGVGWGRRDDGDAVFLAQTAHLDRMMSTAPWCLLNAHGRAVGMPSEQDMGNSEVGHNAMGAGRVFDQGSKLVGQAIETGRIWQSAAWGELSKANTLHLIGLLSDGNVHSHVDHLYALINQAVADGVSRILVHILTDGRDVAGRSALTWVRPLEQHLKSLPVDGAIASGGGRMGITMDRYGADWDMVERGWAVHVHGSGRRFASASKAIETLYAEDPQIDDQYLPPFVIGEFRGIMDGDAVVLCNFRGDRAMELSRAFDDDVFSHFDRGRRPKVFFAGLMEYDGDLGVPKHFLVEPPAIDNTVSHHLEQGGKRSLAISETQKFGHVTYFFNGNRGTRPTSEEWLEVPSLNTPFDKTPQMAAREITEAVVQALSEGGRDHIRLNLANGDMVGHTGKMAATIAAMEVIDECLGALATATAAANGVLIITADHGNADQMFALDKKTGQYRLDTHNQRVIRPSHTLNPVPFVLLDSTGRWSLSARSGPHIGGGLANVGGTLLQLCGLKAPAEYAPSLVQQLPR